MLASTHDSSDDNSSPTTDIDLPLCKTRKTAIFSYTGGDKKNQKTKETDRRAKSESKEEDEDHNDDGGPGGIYTVNVSDFETGQVHQVDRVRLTRDTGGTATLHRH